ncbi:MAG: PilZ domain-containing protein [Deltaproteobacteria bacterium]|nr:PilZ domain-containing protein [Deltaproteobacteria bacterium]
MQQRHTMRCELKTHALIASRQGSDRALVRNISLDGLAWRTDRPLQKGAMVDVLISLALGCETLRMKGEVVWAHGARSGLRFTTRDPHFSHAYFKWCRKAQAVSREVTRAKKHLAPSSFTPRFRSRIPTLPLPLSQPAPPSPSGHMFAVLPPATKRSS